MIRYKARAKINLGLDVLGRRPNGYHDVAMIMQSISLCDELTFSVSEEPGIRLTCDDPALSVGEDNLILRAARRLLEGYELKQGIRIHLDKQIPMEAGLAGGSTDAAATLLGINELLGLGKTKEELAELGGTIGADIPFCVFGGTRLAEGIGEILTELPPMPDCFILIGKPPTGVSTKYVYEHFRAGMVTERPDLARIREGLEKQDLSMVLDGMANVLESVTIPVCREIETIRQTMLSNGALAARMSGSGPTVFGIFERSKTAEEAMKALKKTGLCKNLLITTPYH